MIQLRSVMMSCAVSPCCAISGVKARPGTTLGSDFIINFPYKSQITTNRLKLSMSSIFASVDVGYNKTIFKDYLRSTVPDKHLETLLSSFESAVKDISLRISRAGIDNLMGVVDESQRNSSGDKQKKLDVVANELLKEALTNSGQVSVLASEEDKQPVLIDESRPFVAVFDPLDGSRNIDASIPTGTIIGFYKTLQEDKNKHVEERALANVLQPGSSQVAAAYALYSSATMIVLTLGDGVSGFTLDPVSREFILSHPNIQVPKRGQIYSVNDARYFDWPKGLRNYIDTVRQGKGEFPKKYSARYICSLVADLHRTLLYGGVAMNPREHLRLLYEANPLSFITENAGGQGSDGKRRVLDIVPSAVHQRLPLFLGSTEDIRELESYGDVQQLVNPGYEV